MQTYKIIIANLTVNCFIQYVLHFKCITCDGHAQKHPRTACVCASAGHTFEDDTIE